MSYGLPEQPRRRGGIGKLIFPAILFFGALMFFRSLTAPRENPAGPQDRAGQGGVYTPERSSQDDEYRIKEGLFEPEGQEDEYKVKEGLFEPKGASTGQPMPSRQTQGTANSTGGGKWSMEDVDGNDASNGSASTPKSNKTQNGQWSIEEVDGEATKEKPRFRFSEQ